MAGRGVSEAIGFMEARDRRGVGSVAGGRRRLGYLALYSALAACPASAFAPRAPGVLPAARGAVQQPLVRRWSAQRGLVASIKPDTKRPPVEIPVVTPTQASSPFDPLALQAEGGAVDEQPKDLSLYKGLLLLVAVIWGSNFGALKYLDTSGVDVSVLTALRFFLASLALAPFLKGQPLGLVKAGLEVGLWVTLGYVTQAIGLQTTEASKSAFICSLTVVVVPLINGLLGKKISTSTWASCLLAVFGVGLLTLQGTSGPVIGDLWSLGQPLGFGIAFMRIEHYMAQWKGKALPLAAGQMLSVFLCSVLWAGVSTAGFTHLPDTTILQDPAHAAALVYTGVVTSALAVVLESIALTYVPAEETAVIFSTEPLWAAVTSALVLGERLKPAGYAGGAAILAACLLTQVDASALAALLPLAKLAEESSIEKTIE